MSARKPAAWRPICATQSSGIARYARAPTHSSVFGWLAGSDEPAARGGWPMYSVDATRSSLRTEWVRQAVQSPTSMPYA